MKIADKGTVGEIVFGMLPQPAAEFGRSPMKLVCLCRIIDQGQN